MYFENLDSLCLHIKYLQTKLDKKNIYIVGGAVRNILLGLEENPLDVDITLNSDPEKLYSNINKDNISIFKTDKFGTITIIPRKEDINSFWQKGFYIDKEKQLQYEITPFREEGQYGDFRHPDEINWTDDLLEDSKRRDFTINCLYFYYKEDFENSKNPEAEYIKTYENIIKQIKKNGYIFFQDKNLLILQDHDLIKKFTGKKDFSSIEKLLSLSFIYDGKEQSSQKGLKVIIDPFCGINDLFDKKICAVNDPDNRFQEDALRIIRGVRFGNVLNEELKDKEKLFLSCEDSLEDDYFDFSTETRKSMKKNYLLTKFIAKERIKEEIVKIFKKGNPFGGISLLDELNILQYLFPALERTKGNYQPTRFHSFDTYTHTLLSLYNFQEINNDFLAKLGMLYHDVGKPDQYYFASIGLSEEEKKKLSGSYIYHTNLGAEFCKKDFENLGFSKKEIEEIVWYVKFHMAPGDILSSKIENIPKKLKKRMSNNGYRKTKNLIDIAKADRLGQYNPLQPSNIKGLDFLEEILEEIYQEQGEFSMKDMAINGKDIMKELKIASGPKVGEYLKTALDRVLEDPNKRNNKNEILNFLKSKIK